MDHKAKLELFIDKLNNTLSDIDKHANEQYEQLKAESTELFKVVENKLHPDCRKYVKLQVNYGNHRPNKSTSYIIFDIGLVSKIELKFNDDRTYELLAFYIEKINSNIKLG